LLESGSGFQWLLVGGGNADKTCHVIVIASSLHGISKKGELAIAHRLCTLSLQEGLASNRTFDVPLEATPLAQNITPQLMTLRA
jgi:hypothetical protein